MGSKQEKRIDRQSVMEKAKTMGKRAYNMRSVLMALPVIVIAIIQAIVNIAKLPSKVGLDMLASGEFQFLVGKGLAVMGPLILTCLCLLLMFCSKKILYPWLISVFSLMLPIVLWLTNSFTS